MTDYGTSYFDALKRYVRLQREFEEYRRRSRMRFVAMMAICWGSCVIAKKALKGEKYEV